jgi:hypothetical protein
MMEGASVGIVEGGGMGEGGGTFGGRTENAAHNRIKGALG